mmetsp:Transcript_103157/g.204934  ORF Transcript_103157/g.204934 Transcript_103157/m.204934 type:complete len:257 (-) Transcript_103157:3-773(-)
MTSRLSHPCLMAPQRRCQWTSAIASRMSANMSSAMPQIVIPGTPACDQMWMQTRLPRAQESDGNAIVLLLKLDCSERLLGAHGACGNRCSSGRACNPIWCESSGKVCNGCSNALQNPTTTSHVSQKKLWPCQDLLLVGDLGAKHHLVLEISMATHCCTRPCLMRGLSFATDKERHCLQVANHMVKHGLRCGPLLQHRKHQLGLMDPEKLACHTRRRVLTRASCLRLKVTLLPEPTGRAPKRYPPCMHACFHHLQTA